MNPFNQPLNRVGFLFLTLVNAGLVALYNVLKIFVSGLGHGIDLQPLQIAFVVAITGLSLLTLARRLEDTGQPKLLSLSYFLPPIGGVLWFALFFVPSQSAENLKTERAARSAISILFQVLWQIVFWLLTIIIAVIATANTSFHMVDVIDFALTLVAMAGLFGYAFRVPLLRRAFWRNIALAVIAYHYLYIFALDGPYGAMPAKTLSDYLTGALVPLPLYVGLLLYAFAPNKIFK